MLRSLCIESRRSAALQTAHSGYKQEVCTTMSPGGTKSLAFRCKRRRARFTTCRDCPEISERNLPAVSRQSIVICKRNSLLLTMLAVASNLLSQLGTNRVYLVNMQWFGSCFGATVETS